MSAKYVILRLLLIELLANEKLKIFDFNLKCLLCVCKHAVSYTHLDVYKRQVQEHVNNVITLIRDKI